MSTQDALKTNYTSDGEYIFSVSELNRTTKSLLEKHFGDVWVKGELSNVSKPASGHVYFTLKDQMGQIKCALFRQSRMGLKCEPENGQSVLVRAKASLYPQRGDFQLIVSEIIDYGSGHLQQQFEALKAKLQAEGLFNPEHKLQIPRSIQTLGVVTSGSGAALHDICSVLERRFPLINVIVYCSSVQGELAPRQLIAAIKQAETENRIDALLISRGGGSMEDLWAFNDETLNRTIYNCPIPTVSAVGHEVDFTLADFVADIRAPTPSAAAELLSPDKAEIKIQLAMLESKVARALETKITTSSQTLFHLKKRLTHPREMLAQNAQHLDYLLNIIHKNIHRHLLLQKQVVTHTINRLFRGAPKAKISRLKQDISVLENRLQRSFIDHFNRKKLKLCIIGEKLDTLSPLKTLGRGYAITTNQNNVILTELTQVQIGEKIKLQLKDGKLDCEVKAKHEN